MIDVQQLTKRYGGRVAVDAMSFTVQPGRITGFLGPNGAGKSTTMRLITGLARPDSGRALVDGRPYADWPSPMLKIGAVLDGPAFHPQRTVRNHLLTLTSANRLAKARADELLEYVGLSGAACKRAGDLSLGMTQRLGLAAALVGDPEVLVLDEPQTGLDPEGVLWLRNQLRSMADAGRTVFLSSHLMNELAVTVDHVIVVAQGRVLADAPVSEIITHTGEEATVVVRTPNPAAVCDAMETHGFRALQTDPDVVTVVGAMQAHVAELLAQDRIATFQITDATQTLEEAFMTLTAGVADHTPQDLAR